MSMDIHGLSADALQQVLRQQASTLPTGPAAAVAAVCRSADLGTELLFIQRAIKASDPWSGHMAFPGGRVDADDVDSHATAERETREEVGLDLATAKRLGSLSDLEPGRHLQAVHCHLYWLAGPAPALTLNYEVADALWVPISYLGDPNRYIDYYYEPSDSSWPGIQLDKPDQVVWGLTLRFLADLFARLDAPFITLSPQKRGHRSDRW